MMRNTLLVVATVGALAHTVWNARNTLHVRFQRDVARMVFNDNLDALHEIEHETGLHTDSLQQLLDSVSTTPDDPNAPYIVVSIADHALWYRKGDSVLFQTKVATGSGKTLVIDGGARRFRFETPRGRLVVQRKDSAPAWVPPDWHYQEISRKKGLQVVQLNRGESIRTSDGSEVSVSGSDVVRRMPDGSTRVLSATEGREIVVDGKVVIPPYGTNQRKYDGILGTRRLYLGDGYGLHGTNEPSSIGHSVSHGCVRLRNEDIEYLYNIVPIGTPVYIY